MKYTMSGGASSVGEGYDMIGKDGGEGKGMGYTMAGPGMELTKGEKAPEANTKGKMKEDRD